MLLENVLIAANPGMAFWIKSWMIDKRIVDLGWYCQGNNLTTCEMSMSVCKSYYKKVITVN